jgi:hypothetical protein
MVYFDSRGQILRGIQFVGAFSKRRRLLVTRMIRAGYWAGPGLRGKDLNLRPLGYEPEF